MKGEKARSFLKKRTKELLTFGCLIWIFPAQAQVVSVQLLGPERDFGYFVGDLVSTEAIITVAPGTVLDKTSLPVPGPLAAGIELRRIDARQAVEGKTSRILIHAEYQNFMSPEQVTVTELPGFSVRLTAARAHTAAHIPGWTFHVSPLRVAQRSVSDLGDLRPNRTILPLREDIVAARLAVSLILAVAGLLVFAGGRGWLPLLRGTKRPFAVAASRIARMSRAGTQGGAEFLEMHRAFDATAGRRVLGRDLDDFISEHPRFADLRPDIAGFFRASERWFFARETDAAPFDTDVPKLAKSLRRRERRR